MLKLIRQHRTFIFLLMIVILLLFYKPTQVRPFWFDEGWTLSIARNWVEFGHYGERSNGEFVPSTILNTGFPATSLYALVFRLFGVGMLQARVLGNLALLVCLVLFYWLVHRLFDKKTAIITLLIALFTGAHPAMIPVLSGRQALGEIPMLVYVLAGFVSFVALRKSHYLLSFVPAVCFALAIHTKPQILPFLMVGLAVGVFLSVIKRDAENTRRYVWVLFGTLIFAVSFGRLWSGYLRSLDVTSAQSTDPYAMVRDLRTLLLYVLVLRWDFRLAVLLQFGWSIGLLGLVGIIAESPVKSWKPLSSWLVLKSTLAQWDTVTAVIWATCASWYAWWALLSTAWPRYIFPAYFLASMFAARWLIRAYIPIKQYIRTRRLQYDTRSQVIVATRIVGVALVVGIPTIRTLRNTAYWFTHPNNGLVEVTHYLNANVRADELIETYESELFFLLDSDYHFPPDEVQHVGHQLEDQNLDLEKADLMSYIDDLHPDYIVTGFANDWWAVYDHVVSGEEYGLVYEYLPYAVYQRVDGQTAP